MSFQSRATRACISPALLSFTKMEITLLKKSWWLNRCYICFFLIAVVSTSEMSAKMTKVMEDSTLNKREWAVKDIPFPVWNKICLKLNIMSPFFDDFRMVAEQLGMDKDTIDWIGQSENPTHKMFTSYHRDAKVGRLIEILDAIGRLDVLKVLEDWLVEP